MLMKKYLVVGSLLTLAMVLMGATVANATSGDKQGFAKMMRTRPELTAEQTADMQAKMEERKTEMEARQTKMQAIFDSGDYNAWKASIEEEQAKRVNVLDVVNADNFAKFAEMHKLMQDKDFAGAKVIADELGLPEGMGMGMGQGIMGGRGHGGMKGGQRNFVDAGGNKVCDNQK